MLFRFRSREKYRVAVVEIRTREITLQVRDQNLYTTNRQNSEASRKSYPDGSVIETRCYHFLSVCEL